MVQEFQPNFQPGLGEIRPMKKHENRGYAIIPSKVHYQPITFTSVGKKKKIPHYFIERFSSDYPWQAQNFTCKTLAKKTQMIFTIQREFTKHKEYNESSSLFLCGL